MSLQDDLPTKSERRPKKGRRLSGAQEVSVSDSLDEFIGNASALAVEPPEPEPVRVAETDPIAERMAQIEEALVRAATRAAALADAPPVRPRSRFGLSAAALALGAFLGVVVLLVGYGRSQGERPVSAAPAPAPVAPPAPISAAAPAPAAPPAVTTAAAPPAASSSRKPARHKVPPRRPSARNAGGSGGIVDPFAN